MTGAVDRSALEATLADVESCMAALGDALRRRDPGPIDLHAGELNRAFVDAVDRFTRAARSSSGIPPPLRDRLACAAGCVAAQREALARATAELDRAIGALLPATERPSTPP